MKKIFLLLSLALIFFSFSSKAEEKNTFIVCDNSMEMLEWDLRFIREASQTIEIVACYAGGKVIRDILLAIEERLEACPMLRVHILTTPILFEPEDKQIVARLESRYKDRFFIEHASNVLIVWPDVSGVDNHVKMLVVDETYFSCGGTNLDHFCCEGTETPPGKNEHPMGDSFPKGSRDQDVVGKGPLATELRQIFYKHFALWKHYNQTKNHIKDPEYFANVSLYAPLPYQKRPFVAEFESSDNLIEVSPSKVKLIIGGPHQKNNAITQEYIRLINGAKEEILIANLYFSPADNLFKALLDAINRGVKVRVITNGVNDRSPGYTQFFCWANRISYVPTFYGKSFHFWEASSCKKQPIKNVKIYEYYVEEVLLHKKLMIVDGKHFAIGSYNLGRKSDMADYELILSIESEEIGKAAKKVYEKDIRHSLEISPSQARDWYFDPFISYLAELQRKFNGLY